METELIEKVYSQYEGMEEDYIKIVRDFHEVMRDGRYSDDFKLDERKLAKEDLLKLKQTYSDKALEQLNKLEESLTKQAPAEIPSETEQLKNIILWEQVLRTMGREEFKEVWAKNRENKDFRMMAESILKSRNKETWLIEFEADFNSKSSLEKYLQKHRLFVRSLAGMGDTVMIPRTDKVRDIKYTRIIRQDLDNFSGTLEFKLASGHKLG